MPQLSEQHNIKQQTKRQERILQNPKDKFHIKN